MTKVCLPNLSDLPNEGIWYTMLPSQGGSTADGGDWSTYPHLAIRNIWKCVMRPNCQALQDFLERHNIHPACPILGCDMQGNYTDHICSTVDWHYRKLYWKTNFFANGVAIKDLREYAWQQWLAPNGAIRFNHLDGEVLMFRGSGVAAGQPKRFGGEDYCAQRLAFLTEEPELPLPPPPPSPPPPPNFQPHPAQNIMQNVMPPVTINFQPSHMHTTHQQESYCAQEALRPFIHQQQMNQQQWGPAFSSQYPSSKQQAYSKQQQFIQQQQHHLEVCAFHPQQCHQQQPSTQQQQPFAQAQTFVQQQTFFQQQTFAQQQLTGQQQQFNQPQPFNQQQLLHQHLPYNQHHAPQSFIQPDSFRQRQQQQHMRQQSQFSQQQALNQQTQSTQHSPCSQPQPCEAQPFKQQQPSCQQQHIQQFIQEQQSSQQQPINQQQLNNQQLLRDQQQISLQPLNQQQPLNPQLPCSQQQPVNQSLNEQKPSTQQPTFIHQPQPSQPQEPFLQDHTSSVARRSSLNLLRGDRLPDLSRDLPSHLLPMSNIQNESSQSSGFGQISRCEISSQELPTALAAQDQSSFKMKANDTAEALIDGAWITVTLISKQNVGRQPAWLAKEYWGSRTHTVMLPDVQLSQEAEQSYKAEIGQQVFWKYRSGEFLPARLVSREKTKDGRKAWRLTILGESSGEVIVPLEYICLHC